MKRPLKACTLFLTAMLLQGVLFAQNDSTRFSISISMGWAIPLGEFNSSASITNSPSQPSYLQGNSFKKETAGGAKSGNSISIGLTFSPKHFKKWSIQVELGETTNSVDVSGAQQFLNSSYAGSDKRNFRISQQDYSVGYFVSGLSYQMKQKDFKFLMGPRFGVGVMKYPYYEIQYEQTGYRQNQTIAHVGARPDIFSLMYGLGSEICLTWLVKTASGRPTRSRIDFGFNAQVYFSDFHYYSSITYNSGLSPNFSEDYVNYRILNLSFKVGYRF